MILGNLMESDSVAWQIHQTKRSVLRGAKMPLGWMRFEERW